MVVLGGWRFLMSEVPLYHEGLRVCEKRSAGGPGGGTSLAGVVRVALLCQSDFTLSQ